MTTHGLAVNVGNDLEPFSWIVPCGLPDVEMTSLEIEADRPVSVETFGESFAAAFAAELERFSSRISREQLDLALSAAATL